MHLPFAQPATPDMFNASSVICTASFTGWLFLLQQKLDVSDTHGARCTMFEGKALAEFASSKKGPGVHFLMSYGGARFES